MNLNEVSRFDIAADERAANIKSLWPIKCVLEACEKDFTEGDDYVEVRDVTASDLLHLGRLARERAACEADLEAFIDRARERWVPNGLGERERVVRWEA